MRMSCACVIVASFLFIIVPSLVLREGWKPAFSFITVTLRNMQSLILLLFLLLWWAACCCHWWWRGWQHLWGGLGQAVARRWRLNTPKYLKGLLAVGPPEGPRTSSCNTWGVKMHMSVQDDYSEIWLTSTFNEFSDELVILMCYWCFLDSPNDLRLALVDLTWAWLELATRDLKRLWMRYIRENLCAPACSQGEETWPQVTGWIYSSATVSRHRHGDPQDDHSHYGRNQLWGGGGIPLFTQTQDAQHQHASAHYLMQSIEI